MPRFTIIMRVSIMAVAAVMTTLCLHVRVTAQANDPGQKVDAMIAQRISETGTPGFAVAVLVGGKAVHLKGYGIANVETGAKVTPDSVFNIASVTKTFTSLAVMKLAEEGRLSLDDPLSRHFDNMPAAWRPITIRQLLSHTSGIPGFTDLTVDRCNKGRDPRTYARGDAIDEVSCMPLDFAPGEKWKYAETGYYIAGMLIEKIAGVPYERYLERAVLLPLGMNSTRIVSYDEIVPNRVAGYSFANGKLRNAARFEFEEFSLMSSVADMARLEQAFRPERILRKASIDAMQAKASLNGGGKVENYGIGLGLSPYKGHRRFGHNGGGGLGFAASFTHFPDQGVTVVVLGNADQQGIGDLANAIAEIYFK